MVTHRWQWLRVPLGHGPADHPCSQVTMERMEELAPQGACGAMTHVTIEIALFVCNIF